MSQTNSELREAIKEVIPENLYVSDLVLNSIMAKVADHDQALKQKLLAALPEKKDISVILNPDVEQLYRGNNQTLTEVTQTIERIFDE